MYTRSMTMNNNSEEPFSRDMSPIDKLYINLTLTTRIPSESQVMHHMKRYGIVRKIKYDIGRFGVARGIFVWFDQMDTSCEATHDMLTNLAYGDHHTIKMKYRNSLQKISVNYVVTAPKETNTRPIADVQCATRPRLRPLSRLRPCKRPRLSNRRMSNMMYVLVDEMRVIKSRLDGGDNDTL